MKTSDAIADFLLECRARGLARGTIDQYLWALRRLEAECPEVPGRGRELLTVLGDPTLAPESRRDLVKCLRTFFQWCVRMDVLDFNPAGEIGALPYRRRIPRVLTNEEVRGLLSAAQSERDRIMVLLVMDCGIRLGELASLQHTSIRDNHLVVSGKVGDRMVPISQTVRARLEGQGDSVHIWMGQRGPLTRSGIQGVFKRLVRRAGIGTRKAGPHTLRHTFATTYIAGGGSVFALQQIMGHTRLATTQIYVTLAQSQVIADHAQHSPICTMNLANEVWT